jgi:hypothetical protein
LTTTTTARPVAMPAAATAGRKKRTGRYMEPFIVFLYRNTQEHIRQTIRVDQCRGSVHLQRVVAEMMRTLALDADSYIVVRRDTSVAATQR